MYSYNNMEVSKTDEIEYAKRMYNSQVKKVKEEEYICDVLKSNYVMQVKSDISRYDLVGDTFHKAYSQVNEKLKKNRKELEIIKDFIFEDFFNNNRSFKLKEIICCGYENYAWNVKFEGYGQTFSITIPVKKNITIKNIESAYDGMFAFYKEESNGIWNLLKKSYKIKDIADVINEYFELDKVDDDDY